MEQLIIFLLLVAGSIISSYLQKKKKQEAEAQRRGELPTPVEEAKGPPFSKWPKGAAGWQEELRRFLEQAIPPPPDLTPASPPPVRPKAAPVAQKREVPPPVIKPVLFESSEGDLEFTNPLKASTAAYTRASNVHERVEARMKAVDQQTEKHRPTQKTAKGRTAGLAWTADPEAARQAFIASVIFAPPLALAPEPRPWV